MNKKKKNKKKNETKKKNPKNPPTMTIQLNTLDYMIHFCKMSIKKIPQKRDSIKSITYLRGDHPDCREAFRTGQWRDSVASVEKLTESLGGISSSCTVCHSKKNKHVFSISV